MVSRLSALKFANSAHMSEPKKTKDVLLKTEDGLLKTEDILLKTKDGPSVNGKLLTHILTNIPNHPYIDIQLGQLQ